MLPEQVSDHCGKKLSVGKWPIFRRQSSVITRDERTRNNQKERRARHEQSKPV
jgi:hypothetical protein